MRQAIVLLAAGLMLAVAATDAPPKAKTAFHAKPSVKKPVTAPTKAPSVTPGLSIADTKTFFLDFISKSKPPEKSEFETDTDYQKRLPPAFDTKKVIYFIAEMQPETDKNYKYDIATKTLSVLGGWQQYSDDRKSIPSGATSIAIRQDYKDLGSYNGTTAGGANVSVSKASFLTFVLDFRNQSAWPVAVWNALDAKTSNKHLSVSVPMEPLEAEALSKHIELVIGVTLAGYSNTDSEITFRTTPTFDDPSDLVSTTVSAEANLVSLTVLDTASKKIITQVFVKGL